MRKCTLLEEVISAFVLASCILRKTSKNINPVLYIYSFMAEEACPAS